MTNREFYTIVSSLTATSELSAETIAEIAQHAKTALAQMNIEQNARKAKNSAKHAEENAPLVAQATELLLASTEPMTAKQISENLNISVPKATAIAKAIPGVIIGKNGTTSRAVNIYSLPKQNA